MKKKLQNKKIVRKPVKVARPLNSEEAEMKAELDTASALEAVAISQGGIIIRDGLIRDIVGLVTTLSVKYKSATQLELVSVCADLKTKLDLLHVLSRAGKNKDFLIEQLGDALEQ